MLVVLCLLALPGSALAARQVPVGLANTNDQNLRDSRWLYAIRFVVDEDTKLYRFFSQMKAKGASWDEHSGSKCSSYGAGCYGAGDGGRIQARLVPVRPDGTPDLSRVLAQETVDPRTRYAETKAAYSIKLISLFWYFNMGGVALKAGTPYAMVYRNVHGDPAHNFTSTNSPTVKESEAGPNGRNNLDPNAAGAIAGLDPREAVAWSTDDGRTWKWGRQVGPYQGDASSDNGTRLPHYAWQASPTSKPESNQPYTAYLGTCSACTLRLSGAPRAVVLTEAGGYAPVGRSVGTVTVRNLRTGQTGRTGPLGAGIVKGALSSPVAIAAGDSYEITQTGTVYRAEADDYLVQILDLGTGDFAFNTAGQGPDRAQVFALPHPWFKPTPAAVGPRQGVALRRPGRRRARKLRVGLRHASLSRNARRVSAARKGPPRKLVRRVSVEGRVRGGRVRSRPRVALQRKRPKGWKTVRRGRLRRNGSYSLRGRVTMRRSAGRVKVRVVVARVGKSRVLRARVPG